MANSFLTLSVPGPPPAPQVGAPLNVASTARAKTFVIEGPIRGRYIVEASCEDPASASPGEFVAICQWDVASGIQRRIDAVVSWVRVRREDQTGAPAPSITMGASDDGA